jgi:hypothetical protein
MAQASAVGKRMGRGAMMAAMGLGLMFANLGAGREAAAQDLIPSDLPSSVEALRESHPAAVAQLAFAQRRVEPAAQAVIARLPLSIQEAYYITLQDCPTVEPAAQRRANNLLAALAGLPKPVQGRLVNLVTRTYGPVDGNPRLLAVVRARPHQTLFQLFAFIRRARVAPQA